MERQNINQKRYLSHDHQEEEKFRVDLTPVQEEHLAAILLAFQRLGRKKYEAGQREHGGDLFKKDQLELLTEIREEAIDLFVYAQTAIQKQIHIDREHRRIRGRK